MCLRSVQAEPAVSSSYFFLRVYLPRIHLPPPPSRVPLHCDADCCYIEVSLSLKIAKASIIKDEEPAKFNGKESENRREQEAGGW